MRRLFHLVTLSRPTTDDVIPFLLSLSLSLSRTPASRFVTAAPSPIKPSTKLAARFPEEPTDSFSFSREWIFSIVPFFQSLFVFSLSPPPLYLSLSLSHSLSSIRVLSRVFAVKAMSSFTVRAIVLSWIRPIEKYDPRVYLISASRREFFSLARDHLHVEFRDMCVHTSFSLFYFLFFSASPL